jgi:exopolyphosphatase / guanosine-5'-triphosphate,3'-diphosphate pyrophosphatase
MECRNDGRPGKHYTVEFTAQPDMRAGFHYNKLNVMYAVIDLGSNSFHLLVAEYTGCHFSVIDRCSNKIQLADGLSHSGKLTQAAIERGLDCLRLFKQTLSQHPVRHLHVVATQALRQATNARAFIEPAQALGFNIEIISGTREAELVFRGVCDPLPDCDGNRLVIDIGGASTEIAVGRGRHIVFAQSLPMGCVSWRDRFFAGNIGYSRQSVEAKNAARAILQPLTDTLVELGWCEVYASSGSAKMMSAIAVANQWTRGKITHACINHIEAAFKQVKQCSDIVLPGLDIERRDLLAPGISIMNTIMASLGIDAVTYSSTALREGLLGEVSKRRLDHHLMNFSEDALQIPLQGNASGIRSG